MLPQNSPGFPLEFHNAFHKTVLPCLQRLVGGCYGTQEKQLLILVGLPVGLAVGSALPFDTWVRYCHQLLRQKIENTHLTYLVVANPKKYHLACRK